MTLALSASAGFVPVDTTSSRGCSSTFGSARSHWPYEPSTSSRLTLPSADLPLYYPSSTHTSSRHPSEDSSHSRDGLHGESTTEHGDDFSTLIREHGAPLDTITERTSVSTIRDVPTLSDFPPAKALRDINRASSAPEPCSSYYEGQRDPRATKSLDEELLEGCNSLPRLEVISEISEPASQNNDATKTGLSTIPLLQVTTNSSGTRSREASTTSSPLREKVAVHRKTSSYVRGIYRKLVGGSQCDFSSQELCEDSSGVSQGPHLETEAATEESSFAVTEGAESYEPVQNVNNGRPGLAKRNDHEIGVREGKTSHNSEHIEATRDAFREDSGETRPQIAEGGLPNSSNKLTGHLPRILAKTSRMFGSPKSRSTPKKSEIACASSPTVAAGHGHIGKGVENISPENHRRDSGISVSVARPEGEVRGSAHDHLCHPVPTPLPVRNRSIFDICATECHEIRHFDECPGHQSVPCENSLSVRNGLPASPATRTSNCSTPNSWDLPLEPFPQPPSPNYFVTPPSTMRLDAGARPSYRASHRSTAGVKSTPPSFDLDLEYCSGGKASRQSSVASESSTSLVTGEAMSQEAPKSFSIHCNDPFGPRCSSRALNNASTEDAVFKMSDISTTPVYMPLPLRPMRKPCTRYSLFPSSENDCAPTFTALPERAPNFTIRSLGSMLRLPSDTMRASKSSVLGQSSATPSTCEHGKPVNRIGVFSGRKLGSKWWRMRHWFRDRRDRCWKCTLKRAPARLHSYGAGISSRLRRGEHSRRMKLDAAKPRVMRASPRTSPPRIAVSHPLEEIERRRTARQDGRLDGSASLVKAMSLVDRWSAWAPRGCFCQKVDDSEDESPPPRQRSVTATQPLRSTRSRREID